MKENSTNSDLSLSKTILESPLNNENLVKFIFELTSTEELENIAKLDLFLDSLQRHNIEIKISETPEFLISHCLTHLITHGRSKQAQKLSEFISIASASDIASYHIVSGILNSRSAQTIDDIVQIIQNFVDNGLNSAAKSEDGKTIMEYAVEQYVHSVSSGSLKVAKIKAGDGEIVKSLIQSIMTPLKKSDKIKLCDKINSKTFTSEEFQEALENFNNATKAMSADLDNKPTTSLVHDELDEFLNKDVKIKPTNNSAFTLPTTSPRNPNNSTNLPNSISPSRVTKYFL